MALFSFYGFTYGDNMTKHHNDPKAFPNLKLEELQNRAIDWVDYFYAVTFEEILLYHHDRRPLLHPHDKRRYELIPKESRIFRYWRSIEYVLVFVISNYPAIDLSKIEDYPMGVVKEGGKLFTKRINGSDDNDGLWEWIHSLKQILNPDQIVNSPTDRDFYKKCRKILKRPN